MGPEQWAAIIVAVAGALGLRELLPGLVGWIGGRDARDRDRLERLIRERDQAEAERDDADRRRRLANEHASQLRRLLTEMGGAPPDWPV